MDQVATSPSPSILTRIAGRLRSGFGDRIPVRRRSPDSGLALPAGIALRLGGAVLATLIGGAQPSAQLIQPELAELSSGLELATAAAEAGQFEEARRLFLQLQENFPGAPEPRLGLANLVLALGEPHAARRVYGEALQRAQHDDHRAQAELGLGRTALRFEDAEEAQEHFRAAESLDPVSPRATRGSTPT